MIYGRRKNDPKTFKGVSIHFNIQLKYYIYYIFSSSYNKFLFNFDYYKVECLCIIADRG